MKQIVFMDEITEMTAFIRKAKRVTFYGVTLKIELGLVQIKVIGNGTICVTFMSEVKSE